MSQTRGCRYCQQSFQPSPFRPKQSVCSHPDCQRRRCADYHRQKVRADDEYAQVVRDSQKKWCEAHRDYWKQYRRQRSDYAERNRQLQRRRDQKRRLLDLAKNNLALDLKRSAAEVWLLGSSETDLAKNNLASCQVFIVQSVEPPPATG